MLLCLSIHLAVVPDICLYIWLYGIFQISAFISSTTLLYLSIHLAVVPDISTGDEGFHRRESCPLENFDGNAGVGDGGGVVRVIAGPMGNTRLCLAMLTCQG